MKQATTRRICAAVLGALIFSPAAWAEELVSLVSPRPDVTLKLLVLPVDKPIAAAILFAGGHGAIGLSGSAGAPSIGWGKNNFLVRTRGDFARAGLLVAVVDAPSDRSSNTGMLGGFRASEEHAQDIEAVVRYLKGRADVPVWLVGTSRGTESAANAAIRMPGVAGLVLTSSLTQPNKKGVEVLAMKLEDIRVPTLVVAHQDDECDHTPPADAPRLAKHLVNSPRVELKMLHGGKPAKSAPCEALSAHGFFGIEQEAVDTIVQFIKAAR